MQPSVLAIIIIGIAIVSFALEKIPLPVTAMLAALAMGVSGIISFSDVYSGFATTSVMMVAGMLVIGNCIFETGLANWLGQKLVRTPIVKNERLFLFVILIFASALSAFLSNTAVTSACIPLVGAIVLKSSGTISNKNIVMPIGIAAAVGGACTIVGSTAQLTAQQILEGTAGCRSLGFFELAWVGVPLCLATALYFATIGYNIEKKHFTFPDVNTLGEGDVTTAAPEHERITWKMALSGMVMLLCVAGFVLNLWNAAIIALVGASVLLAARCMDFKKAMRAMDWNTLVILGAAQGFAKGLEASGGGQLITDFTLSLFGGKDASPLVLLLVGIVVSTVLTNFMSNTAVLAMMTPIFIHIAFQLGVQPEIFILGCIIGGSIALATPIGTPSVTQTLVAGYRFMDYVRVGLPLTVLLTVLTCILCPLVYDFVPII